MFKNRNDAGKVILELTKELIKDDVLMVRVVPGECNLTIEFSFDYDNIVREWITAWYVQRGRCSRGIFEEITNVKEVIGDRRIEVLVVIASMTIGEDGK